ncbi:hypothetical protein H4Q26_004538 [Puccinia striiformis f. sp. tritici PST-130]|nr:hypothetical protein H4Q26_004538 [Puccinia striiformis f. sp. tritici PST-130]
MGKGQILAQTFSTEEAAKLIRDLPNRLVYGNYIQHLNIIVGHCSTTKPFGIRTWGTVKSTWVVYFKWSAWTENV